MHGELFMMVWFLEGKIEGPEDLTLADLWAMTDKEIEYDHDSLQWIFPLRTPSVHSLLAPVLEPGEIDDIQASVRAKKNLVKSAHWFLGFLQRNHYWTKPKDHNQKRIGRVIECLKLLVSDEEADNFRNSVLEILGDDAANISGVVGFWKKI
jgi:hypothetical protein